MRVKTYRAHDMSTLLPVIRSEMGPDAVILEARNLPPQTPTGPLARFRPPQTMIEVTAAAEDLSDLQPLAKEIADIKAALLGFQQMPGFVAQPVASPALAATRARLVEQGLPHDEAQAIIEAVATALGAERLADAKAVRQETARRLRQSLPPTRLNFKAGSAVFLVGPNGVGKTTTIAKLAGQARRQGQQDVALISIDTVRVGAMAQLETYARLMGLPLAVAYTPAELTALLQKHADKGLVLVDTPGVSPLAAAALDDLKGYLTQATARTVLLTLACSTRFEDMRQAAERFRVVPLDGVLFTKLDETSHYGSLYRFAAHVKLPLTYATTGTRVPQDLETVMPDTLVSRLLGGA